METDWSVAAGADDPMIEAPWADAATGLRFTSLRLEPAEQQQAMAAIPEAAASPTMASALALLNQRSRLLMTSKCDRWTMDGSELAELADVLDAPLAAHGCASYLDILMVHAVPMADFPLHEEWARMASLRAAALAHPEARLDLIVRAASHNAVWGYGLTAYVYAGGADGADAETKWAAALTDVVPILIATAEATLAPADTVQKSER